MVSGISRPWGEKSRGGEGAGPAGTAGGGGECGLGGEGGCDRGGVGVGLS